MFGVILLAGGKGLRFGRDLPKQFIDLKNKPIFVHSLELFCQNSEIGEIVIVCDKEYRLLCEVQIENVLCRKINIYFAEPGERRQDSVYSGLQKLNSQIPFVCVHDAARPLLKPEHFSKLLREAKEIGAAALGVPLKFTVKECEQSGQVIRTPARERLWEIQTPQVVKRQWLQEGFDKAHRDNLTVTDDVSLVELVNYPVKIVAGDYSNIKITTPEDLVIAEQLLSNKEPV